MLTWIGENIGTIAIAALLLAVVVRILFYIIRSKRKNTEGCSSGCCGCSGGSGCCSQSSAGKIKK